MKILLSPILLSLIISCNTNGTENLTTQAMENENYKTIITVSEDAVTSFNAIQNFRAWWSEEIEGPTDKIGESFIYHYKNVHWCKLKLIEEVPNQKLVYLVVDNKFNFTKDERITDNIETEKKWQ